MTDERVRLILAAVKDGRITEGEADAYLVVNCHLTYREAAGAAPLSKHRVALLAAVPLLAVLAAVLVTMGPTLTGLVTLNTSANGTANTPPELVIAFNNTLVNGTTEVGLGQHFADPDGDALYYTVGTSGLVTASVDGDTLTLDPLATGTGTITVYASDLSSFVSADVPLDVHLASAAPVAAAPVGPVPAALDPVVGTPAAHSAVADTGTALADTAVPVVAQTAPKTVQVAPAAAVQQDTILVVDEQQASVGSFTPVGNLLIRGVVVERSAGSPGADDWSLGAVWIDSVSGDLHLGGVLHESVAAFPSGAQHLTLVNDDGVVQAVADVQAGDLYVRGNVVPRRTTLR